MRLFEHADFEQAIIQAAEHFRAQGLQPATNAQRQACWLGTKLQLGSLGTIFFCDHQG
jgi:hypothetical protein